MSVTGHRPASLDNDYTYSSELWRSIRRSIASVYERYEPEIVHVGGALGVDYAAAVVAKKLGVPFELDLPFRGYDARWPEQSRKQYESLYEAAERVVYVSEPPYAFWKYPVRNKYMVDNSDVLLAVWNGNEKGGTWDAIQYARSVNVPIHQIGLQRATIYS